MKIVKDEIAKSTTTVPTGRAYQSPRLTEYGDVRHLTQGGTAGVAEDMNSNSMAMV